MIRFEFKNEKEFQRKLKRYEKRSNRKFRDALTDSTDKMQRLQVHDAPKDDGSLAQGIIQEINTRGGEMQGSTISTKNYSKAVEDGTRPHTIRVRYKKVLAGPKRKAPSGWNNFSRDWAIYGKKVQHPGTRPQPFMKPGFNVANKYFLRRLKESFK